MLFYRWMFVFLLFLLLRFDLPDHFQHYHESKTRGTVSLQVCVNQTLSKEAPNRAKLLDETLAKRAAGVLGKGFQKTQYTRKLFQRLSTLTVCHLSNPFQSFPIFSNPSSSEDLDSFHSWVARQGLGDAAGSEVRTISSLLVLFWGCSVSMLVYVCIRQ